MTPSKKKVSVLKFASPNTPQPTETYEKTNIKPVYWGNDDLYPNFILKLYQESTVHSAIVNAKANYIIGDGLKYKSGSTVDVRVNANDSINEFVNKVVLDYILFNGFAVEVVYNKLLQPIEYHHVPFQKIRTNKDKNKFWFYENIILDKRNYTTFERWKPIAQDDSSKLFYFDGYFPSINNVYPTPEYNGAIMSIQTEIAIMAFNLNNIKNHFSVSSVISFFRGSSLPEDVKHEIVKGLENTYSGENGKKLIVDFLDRGEQPADVKTLSAGDWDKQYTVIAEKVVSDIMQGHSVGSPSLFAVQTPGKLGGSQEMEESYEIFKANYVRVKRNVLIPALNNLFKDFEAIAGDVEFADHQLFTSRMSEETKEKIYTINELRKIDGLPPLPNGDRLLGDSAPTPAPVQQSMKADGHYLSDEDFEKIKHLGYTSEEFDFIEEGEFVTSKEAFNRIEQKFDEMKDIADYLTKNDLSGMTLNEIKIAIRKDLGISITANDLKDTLSKLNKAGLLDSNVSGDNVDIKPTDTGKIIETMYSYDVRPGMGEPIIDKTRPFCRKLVESGRLFSSEDLQTMAGIFGYDVYSYGGGYYTDPTTGKTLTHCRHFFKSRIVSRKPKG